MTVACDLDIFRVDAMFGTPARSAQPIYDQRAKLAAMQVAEECWIGIHRFWFGTNAMPVAKSYQNELSLVYLCSREKQRP
jgi:hypothetical protein